MEARRRDSKPPDGYLLFKTPEVTGLDSGCVLRYAEMLMSGRDWKAIAKSSGLSLSAKEVEAASEALENLQKIFQPLIRDLTPDVEPALRYEAEGENE